MITCLTKKEIGIYSEEIQEEFERLMKSPQVAVKPHAKQWGFFRHCFDALIRETDGEFQCTKSSAITYWDEISKKLKKCYDHSHHTPVRFKFWLRDERHKSDILGKHADYKCSNGYLLLVIPTDPVLRTELQIRDILSRVIDDAIHAIFDVFNTPSGENLAALKNYYDPAGSAYKEVLKAITRHNERGEVISNPDNPSTRPQLRRIELSILDEDYAEIWVVEYWNLHWLSKTQNIYVKNYRGR